MDKKTYAKEAMKFAAYDDNEYPFWATIEEFGEFAGKIAKSLRGDKELDMELLRKEAGDILWQLNACVEEDWFPSKGSFIRDYMSVIGHFFECNPEVAMEDFEEVILQAQYGMDPDEIRQENIDKLTDRKNRNVIKGSGDNR